jgi:hypothetical protein
MLKDMKIKWERYTPAAYFKKIMPIRYAMINFLEKLFIKGLRRSLWDIYFNQKDYLPEIPFNIECIMRDSNPNKGSRVKISDAFYDRELDFLMITDIHSRTKEVSRE